MSDFYVLGALTPEKGSSGWVMVEKHYTDPTTKAALQALTDEGYLTHKDEKFTARYKVTSDGHELFDEVTRDEKLEIIGRGVASEAERALWAWLMLHGGEPEFYGGIKRPTSKLLHLAACGLDFDKSSHIESQSWTSFEGTFAENGTDSGIGGRASCQCGMVTAKQLVTQHFTIAQILEGALSL